MSGQQWQYTQCEVSTLPILLLIQFLRQRQWMSLTLPMHWQTLKRGLFLWDVASKQNLQMGQLDRSVYMLFFRLQSLGTRLITSLSFILEQASLLIISLFFRKRLLNREGLSCAGKGMLDDSSASNQMSRLFTDFLLLVMRSSFSYTYNCPNFMQQPSYSNISSSSSKSLQTFLFKTSLDILNQSSLLSPLLKSKTACQFCLSCSSEQVMVWECSQQWKQEGKQALLELTMILSLLRSSISAGTTLEVRSIVIHNSQGRYWLAPITNIIQEKTERTKRSEGKQEGRSGMNEE